MPIVLSRRNALLGGSALLVLAGCQNTPPARPTFPQLTFTHLGQLTFDANKVEVVNEYVPPLKRPNVEHEMPLAPAAAAQRWAADRIHAAGTANRTVRVIIKNASVIETDLRKTPGLRGAFTTDQSEQYDATLEMTVELVNGRGFRDGFASATVRRSRTVPEDMTVNDRDKVYFAMVEGLMVDLNNELTRNISQFMGLYLR